MPSEIFVDFFAGCVGGVAGVLAGHPLDTVKVRLQTQNLQAPTYRGTIHCFTCILRNEGPNALYKGMSSPLASLALINAVIFGVHGQVCKQFSREQQHSLHVQFAAGATAGAVQAFIASPMELLKLRAQILPETGPPSCSSPSFPASAASSSASSSSPFSAARQIWRENGGIRSIFHRKGFNRGLLVTQLRDCPALGVYFASYAFLTRKMGAEGGAEGEQLSGLQLLGAGGGAGLCSWMCNYPMDVVKTRFQADGRHANYAEVIQRTYAERGWRTFFVGLGSTLLRAFPTNAATFFAVEWTCRILLQQQRLAEEAAEFRDQRSKISDNHNAISGSTTCLLLPAEAGCTLQEPMII